MDKIYILGAGAVGLPLAAYLTKAGRNVVAVRTSNHGALAKQATVTVRQVEHDALTVSIETVSLSELRKLDGLVVVTAKSYANRTIASALASQAFAGPLVIMQNGLGVEEPFGEVPFARICRCVLYMTSQTTAPHEVMYRQIASSPIGVVKGNDTELDRSVAALTTTEFRFHRENDIQKEVWKKTIINSVFNSICPLLDVDNGIFVRDRECVELAEEIVRECVVLANARNISLSESEVMEQILRISKGSEGVLISTLQDLRNGRRTEIEHLNLEMVRIASSMQSKISLSRTELLGRMISMKSRMTKKQI